METDDNKEYKEYKELADKRVKSLTATFQLLTKHGYIDGSKFVLNRSLMVAVIKHYLQDLHLLKERYGIKKKALPQKVAGLTASAIMRFRPILPINAKDDTLLNSDEDEIFAIFHGLCLCSENGNGEVDDLVLASFRNKANFSKWLANFIYILRHREYTAESLILAFDTLLQFTKHP